MNTCDLRLFPILHNGSHQKLLGHLLKYSHPQLLKPVLNFGLRGLFLFLSSSF